jgi:hypothetical protein
MLGDVAPKFPIHELQKSKSKVSATRTSFLSFDMTISRGLPDESNYFRSFLVFEMGRRSGTGPSQDLDRAGPAPSGSSGFRPLRQSRT